MDFSLGCNGKAVLQRDLGIFKIVIEIRSFYLELKLDTEDVKGRWQFYIIYWSSV